MNTTIILTSTVNVNLNKSYLFQKNKQERIDTYILSVRQWLEKTDFKIVLVENSGYTFEELNKEKKSYGDKFEVISFIEKEEITAKHLINNESKGESELFAINYAYRNSNILHPSTFIIKITARFFIPDLYDYLNLFNLDKYDCMTQNDRDRCELVGCHYKYFPYITCGTCLET